MDTFKISTIVLGVLSILFLVALMIVSIQLGIAKTQLDIPAMVIRMIALYSPNGLSVPIGHDEAAKADLATLDPVKAAPNFKAFVPTKGDPVNTYWIKGATLVDIDSSGKVTPNKSDPKGTKTYYGLVTEK